MKVSEVDPVGSEKRDLDPEVTEVEREVHPQYLKADPEVLEVPEVDSKVLEIG